MGIVRVIAAHVLAVELASLVAVGGITMMDNWKHPIHMAVAEGIAIWLMGQVVIVPFVVISFPVFLLFRLALGFLRLPPAPVAIAVGTVIGMAIMAFILANSNGYPALNEPIFLSLGASSGAVGGWVWSWVEQPEPYRT